MHELAELRSSCEQFIILDVASLPGRERRGLPVFCALAAQPDVHEVKDAASSQPPRSSLDVFGDTKNTIKKYIDFWMHFGSILVPKII